MKNWISVFAIVCIASVVFATKTSDGAKGYKIQVTSNLAEKTLVVLSKITDAKLEIQDSAYAAKDGAFKFTGSGSEGSSLYYLTFGNTTPPGIPVILENGAQVKLGVTKVGEAYAITLV